MTEMLVDPLSSALDLDGSSGKETRRFFNLREEKTEWNEAGNGKEYTFVGTPAVFNTWSELLWTPRGMFRERFLPGAFSDVLERQGLDCRFLKNHNKDLVLARTKSGTLEIEETEDDLRIWSRVAKTSYATDLKLSMERGDIDQMSLSFELDYDNGAESRWYEDKRSGEVRHDVVKVSDLFDVSVVTFPAYAETSAAVRDIDRAQQRGMISVPKLITRQEAQDRAREQRGRTPVQLSPRSYARCRQAVGETVWAIHPPYLRLINSILEERISSGKPSDEVIQERIGVKRDNEPSTVGSVAVIPLMGPIMARAGAMDQMSGMKSLHDFRSEFRQAVADPEVSHIVIDIDSPGGTVDGVPEMAAEIYKARDVKPVTAVANYMAASAAFWLACAAGEFVMSPSAEVGSVGVYTAHQDWSEAMKMKGVDTTFVHAGEHKVELNPYEPLSDDAKARLQEEVDAIYVDFVGSVAKSRGTTKSDVESNYGQGRMKQAKEALAAGMVDRIATLDDVVAGINKGKKTEKTTSASAVVIDSVTETKDFADFVVEGLKFTGDVALVEELYTGEAVRDFLGMSRQAEIDPAGMGTGASAAEADPAVEADPIVALRERSKSAMQRAREEGVRLTKEMLR